MPFLSWSNDLSVGVKVIDDDHKKLVGIVNELYDGMSVGHAKDALAKVLGRLVEYTKIHFAREEEFFAKTGYQDAAAHHKEHQDLLHTVTELQTRFQTASSTSLSIEVMTFLKNWLTNHIQGSDKRYGPHLNAKGIH